MMKSNSNKYSVLLVFCTVVVFFLSGGTHTAHAQQVGIKTNALMWAGLTPNVGCEIVVGEHSSIDLSTFGNKMAFGPDKMYPKFASKVIAFQPEYRYWFNGRPMVREYIGISSMLAAYDITMNQYVYNGNAMSLGVTGGYAFILGTKWRLELCAGFGFLFFSQKQYYETNDYFVDKSREANSRGYKLIPAKLGVSFTYIIK